MTDDTRTGFEPPADPAVEEALRDALTGPSLAAPARSAHLRRLRERAAVLGPPPAPARPLARWSAPPVRRPATPARWYARLAGSAASVALVGVLGTGTVVAATADTLPGDLGYGIKLLGEQAALSLRGSEAAGGRYLAELAARRLEEAQQLAERGAPPALVAETLTAHALRLQEAAARAGEDPEAATALTEATIEASARLEALLDGGLPEKAADRARDALDGAAHWLERHPPIAPPPDEPGASGQAGAPAERPGHPGGPDGAPAEPERPHGHAPRGQPASPPAGERGHGTDARHSSRAGARAPVPLPVEPPAGPRVVPTAQPAR